MSTKADNFDENDALALLETMAGVTAPAHPVAPTDTVRRAWQPDLRYRSLVERLPVVTFMASLDETQQEIYISPQIESLLGYSQAEWIEDPFLWFRRLHPDDRDHWIAEFARTCSMGDHFRAEYRLLTRADKVVWVQGECQIIRDDTGRPVFLQGIAFDISHIKRAAEDQEARLAAQAASQAKSEFLARMSHEIRTPLNGVVGMIDLLKSTGMSSLQQRYVDLAREAAGSLLTVINDILDFSKIEAGKVEIEAVQFDLHKLIRDLTELLAPVAAKKNLQLACSFDRAAPAVVIGDSNRLRQVLTNLINNAMKFTSEGSIKIAVNLHSREGDSLLVHIAVADTGIGIPADRLDRLFKSFSQVDSSTTRKFGGTGLGLIISKQLIELMGGQIAVKSTVGKGTTFDFTIRLAAGAAALPEAPAQQNQAVTAVKGLHLLVADDNEMNQFVTQETLRRAECTCDIVADGESAVAAWQKGVYDAILMDCQMPGMDGLEATRQIRKREAAAAIGKRIPIIALTAEAIQGDREKCLAAGMDGYVTKPINPDELFAAISSLARRVPVERPRLEGAIDAEALLSRCLNDAQFAAQTLDRFSRRILKDVELLRNGIAAGDIDGTTRLAHNLKSVAAHAAAGTLRRIAFEIEQAGVRRDVKFMAEQLAALDEEARRCAAYAPQAMQRLTGSSAGSQIGKAD